MEQVILQQEVWILRSSNCSCTDDDDVKKTNQQAQQQNESNVDAIGVHFIP